MIFVNDLLLSFLFFILPRYAAQSKTVATEIVILGVDITGPCIQVAPVGS